MADENSGARGTTSRRSRRRISGRWTGWSVPGSSLGTWGERSHTSGWRAASSCSSTSTSDRRARAWRSSATSGPGAEPSADVKSRFYGNTGRHPRLRLRAEGDTLTIWFGERGSPAYYRGTFSEDGNTLAGAWHYPGAAATRRSRPGSGDRHRPFPRSMATNVLDPSAQKRCYTPTVAGSGRGKSARKRSTAALSPSILKSPELSVSSSSRSS